ncbi:MAG: ATP-binding protein [Massilia sp.]
MRAARAISEEIEPLSLFEAILRGTLEQAGARRALLLCMHGDTALIEASAQVDQAGVTLRLQQGLPSGRDLPLSLMQRVIASREPAAAFATGEAPDPYFPARGRCAALCLPLQKQQRLLGLLYLENNAAVAPFSEARIALLMLLAAQAAVSIETARRYGDLLEENAERRRIEQALRESQAMLVLGEQISKSGSWRWQAGAPSIVCSAQFCRMFGLGTDSAEVPFEDFLARVHADDRERVRTASTEAAADGRPILIDYRVVGPDGLLRYISAAGRALAAPGAHGPCESGAVVYVGTAIDVTARRAAEDTLRHAQAELARVARVTTVGQLTASIAHEVNQPLMSISANAGASLRWLERSPPDIGEARAGLRDIAEQSQRAGAIIAGLQALTRKAPPMLAPVDLHQTVRDILAISRAELERNNIALELALMAVSGVVLGDAVQLQQLLLNIVINAVEAMAEVQGRARMLAICSWSTDGGRIAVRIDDAGMGWPCLPDADPARDSADALFEPFYTTKPNGMGMGLAICRSIVTAHHGTVAAMPRQPHGCTVVFYLPEIMGLSGGEDKA